jgi:FAD synthase
MFDAYFIASRMAAPNTLEERLTSMGFPNALEERFNDAVRSMTSMGFPKETVVRKLKKLLTVYGDNWEHIEADNYTTLAGALCDADDPNPKVCSVLLFRVFLSGFVLFH